MNEKALALNFTNEGGINGTIRLLKNIMGLWLLQETKREWERGGKKLSWTEIPALTAQATAFRSLIDPDDNRFLALGDMPQRACAISARRPASRFLDTDAALLRCITESLALEIPAGR